VSAKQERTPILQFEFSDLPQHEELGAVGFRHIQRELELLISGTIRNVGPTLAIDIKLDIYHFKSTTVPPVHEIAGIRIADTLQPDESLQWSKSIRLADLTVDGAHYKSGPTGVFLDDISSKHYHHHVVFSCKNTQGEESSAIYCMEKIVENNAFKGGTYFVTQARYEAAQSILGVFRKFSHGENSNSPFLGLQPPRSTARTCSAPGRERPARRMAISGFRYVATTD
jgi:hypothetical protein